MKLLTKNLILRTVELADIGEVARMWAFEQGPVSQEEAKNAIENMQSNHKKNKAGYIYHLCLAIFDKEANKIIGWCGLDGKTNGKLFIFYMIDANFRNKGYAAQCAERLLAYAFNEVKAPFVNGGCDKNNIASRKVMLKIGMQLSGFEKNGDPIFFIDKEIYRSRAKNILFQTAFQSLASFAVKPPETKGFKVQFNIRRTENAKLQFAKPNFPLPGNKFTA